MQSKRRKCYYHQMEAKSTFQLQMIRRFSATYFQTFQAFHYQRQIYTFPFLHSHGVQRKKVSQTRNYKQKEERKVRISTPANFSTYLFFKWL